MATRPPRFHWLKLRATVHPTEDPERVRTALAHAAGLDPEALDGLTEAVPMESHHGGEMVLLEVRLTRAREVRAALGILLDAATRRALEAELDARLDEDGVFYFRVDKQAAFAGEMVPSRGDDAIQCRLKPEVHPANRDNARAAIAQWLAA